MIKKVYESDCCRCGITCRVANNDTKIPLINKITLSSLNIHGEVIPELEGGEYYICDDCWNDLLRFFDKVEYHI